MQDLRHTMHSTPVNRNVPASIDDLNLVDLLRIVGKRSRLVALGALVIGAAAFGVSFLMTPQFTARTTFIPPQGGTSSLSSMLSSSLGPLAGLAGGGSGGRSGETYVTMLQSRTLRDKLVQRYNLKDLYKARFDFEALEALKQRTRIEYTKKDGVISLEVDDTDPSRAAQIANDYVNELKAMTATMALTDAQRRRKFFELQLNQSKKALADAQRALQASGFDQSALRSEPRAVAEEYGRIKAELTATEVRLTAARSRLADKSPEIQSLTSTAAALRQQLQVLESKNAPTQSQDYVGRYREFKYQETLFEQLSRQYEAARMEESQEDNAVQVLDAALVPEWKSKPKRAAIGLAGALIAAVVLSLGVIIQHLRQLSRSSMNRA